MNGGGMSKTEFMRIYREICMECGVFIDTRCGDRNGTWAGDRVVLRTLKNEKDLDEAILYIHSEEEG